MQHSIRTFETALRSLTQALFPLTPERAAIWQGTAISELSVGVSHSGAMLFEFAMGTPHPGHETDPLCQRTNVQEWARMLGISPAPFARLDDLTFLVRFAVDPPDGIHDDDELLEAWEELFPELERQFIATQLGIALLRVVRADDFPLPLAPAFRWRVVDGYDGDALGVGLDFAFHPQFREGVLAQLGATPEERELWRVLGNQRQVFGPGYRDLSDEEVLNGANVRSGWVLPTLVDGALPER